MYVARFLSEHRYLIRGDVLEVASDGYTRAFGTAGAVPHVVDVRDDNPRADLVADLCVRGALPSSAFDAVILTQTLQFLPRPDVALEGLWEALRPGGTILITVPTASRIDASQGAASDLWRWTPEGLRVHLARVLPDASAEVVGRGNLVTIRAFLLGLGAPEIPGGAFAWDDPLHPLLCTAVVRRHPADGS